MSLRLRYYLAILPLFLGLALINGLLVFHLERNELLWGLEQRAEGSAAALAGFWQVWGRPATAPPSERLQAFSERMGGLTIAHYAWRDGAWWARPLHQSSGLAMPPPPDPPVSAALREGGLAFRYVAGEEGNPDLLVGFAPLLNSEGEVVAAIATVEADRSLREAIAGLLRWLVLLGLMMLTVGLLIAEWLMRFARRELRALNGAARELLRGHHLPDWPRGRIRELNDLGGTLLTMTSLLADSSHQTRRRFFQAELLPGDEDLAATWLASSENHEMLAATRGWCVLHRLGEVDPEDFCALRPSATGWHLLIGRCRRPDGVDSLLERRIHADAAGRFLAGVALARPNGPSWPEALMAFPCEYLQAVFVPASGKAPTGWVLDPVKGLPRPWSPGKGREVLGTLPESALKLARGYASQFSDRALQQVGGELAGLLSSRCQGLLLACDFHASASATETPS